MLTVNARGVATNADKDSRVSVAIARGIADLLLAERGERLAGQTSGSTFEECVMDFVRGTFPLLHASISVKWTIRSDRAQNSRTEALNLIRNRKGHLPHIVVVTAEPVPNRLASLALGTGDIDCVYHFALYELIDSVSRFGNDEAKDTLETLLEGRRLKDISDLPLDLCV